VFVPGYITPMTRDEHLQALHRQVQYLYEQHQCLSEQNLNLQHCQCAAA
jgi:hypothetical protein